MHRPREEVGVLTQHVGHHEGGQLRVGVGVEQAIVWQGVEGVPRLVLHEVQQRRVSVVGGCNWGDLVVFVPGPSSPTTAAASALTGVALEMQGKTENVLVDVKVNLGMVSICLLKNKDGDTIHRARILKHNHIL